jgi:hypothetical protein
VPVADRGRTVADAAAVAGRAEAVSTRALSSMPSLARRRGRPVRARQDRGGVRGGGCAEGGNTKGGGGVKEREHPLAGAFPTGIPVLIHAQLDQDSLELVAGLAIGAYDGLRGLDVYSGRIDAVVAKGSTLQFVRKLEHYSRRISACYWVHISDWRIVAEDFAGHWNEDYIRHRLDILTAGLPGLKCEKA